MYHAQGEVWNDNAIESSMYHTQGEVWTDNARILDVSHARRGLDDIAIESSMYHTQGEHTYHLHHQWRFSGNKLTNTINHVGAKVAVGCANGLKLKWQLHVL
jgi:hypothetical protein